MGLWQRSCPEGLEIRPCEDGKGNGLFTTKALDEGQQLFEEDPVCGMALLMFDQTNIAQHCQHCMRYLEGEASQVSCTSGCGAWYCTEACRDDAFVAHHSVLCSSSNPRWADYEQQARECCNEYYVLAARALAALRADTLQDDLWGQSPWSSYASPCWWETMKRPTYEDSESEDAESSPSFDSEDEESLDCFFQSTVRSQTSEMGEVLLSVLEGKVCALAESLLRSGPEALGRLMGLLRVNAMALHASSEDAADADDVPQDLARGMAIYSVTSAMNHNPAANCFVSSDPAHPQRCLVRTLRPIAPEEELCIDYLQGSPYTEEQRKQVLSQQYGIVA